MIHFRPINSKTYAGFLEYTKLYGANSAWQYSRTKITVFRLVSTCIYFKLGKGGRL